MSMNAFDRLAPFIKEYIYKERWTELREIQVAACDIVFNTNSNLLLSSGTASGKTEAAFLPVLTELYENPSSSVGVLYISPLKALINDQFERLDGLLEYSNIPVWKWHGDVNYNHKQKLLKHPSGVMQITPESLEALIMKKRSDVVRLFSDLRFIIIDEVHYFMEGPRGIQLSSILERIQKLTNNVPRRIGLSATLGDYQSAERWLSYGTNNQCVTPKVKAPKRRLKLYCEYFPLHIEDGEIAGYEDYYSFLYDITHNKKCIIFSNSRVAAERNIAYLRKLSKTKHDRSRYLVHHGNISSVLREDAERQMRESEHPVVTGATVTLELGIDIGSLERIVQTSSPFTVSSFVQRLGRCGRKTQESEMCFLFDGLDVSKKDIIKSANWDFLKCIAIIQLYLEERWIEPVSLPELPFSILYHQTMSIMYSAAELSPASLAQLVLSISVFKNISLDDYRVFLQHLVSIGHLEKTERGSLIVGLKAEPILNNYEFYSVFVTPTEYTVQSETEEIGTIHRKFEPGEVFCLAGFSWLVKDINEDSNIIFVEKLEGLSSNIWETDCYVVVHTKLMQRIHSLLLSEEGYSYISPNGKHLLNQIRFEMQGANAINDEVVKVSDNTYYVLPWVGTKALNVLYLYFRGKGCKVEPINLCFLPIGLIIKDLEEETIRDYYQKAKTETIDPYSFSLDDDSIVIGGKYDRFVEPTLLDKEFLSDYLDVDDLQSNMFMHED